MNADTARVRELTGTPTTRPDEPKVVLVVRTGLPVNQAVNAATVLGASIGTTLSLPLGPGAVDACGTGYAGIVTTPVPILTADSEELTGLFRRSSAREDLTVLTLTEAARRARTYEAYLNDLAAKLNADTTIVGLIIAGTPKPGHKADQEAPTTCLSSHGSAGPRSSSHLLVCHAVKSPLLHGRKSVNERDDGAHQAHGTRRRRRTGSH
jgi:hypothetical protein